MLSFPNCKVNLGLNITQKRDDGYHDLETVFYPVPLKDSLEIIQSSALQFQSSGLQISGAEENNLCIKAYQLLKKDFPAIPSIAIHLHKAIPMGAGLGGGSADGAFMLAMFNKKFKLDLSEKQLLDYALQLGSDCPFFIINKPCFATGRGEVLEQTKIELSPYKIFLINPGIHVSTKDAFSRLNPHQPIKGIKEIIQQPIETWKDELVNDFERTVFELHPSIEKIKDGLYNEGALYAAMTGTGSTVFGLFEKDRKLSLNYPANFFLFES